MSFKQAAASRFGLRLTSLAAQCLTVAALSMTTLSVRADDIVVWPQRRLDQRAGDECAECGECASE